MAHSARTRRPGRQALPRHPLEGVGVSAAPAQTCLEPVTFAERRRIDGLTLTAHLGGQRCFRPTPCDSERVCGVLQVLGAHALSHQALRADPKRPDQIKAQIDHVIGASLAVAVRGDEKGVVRKPAIAQFAAERHQG